MKRERRLPDPGKDFNEKEFENRIVHLSRLHLEDSVLSVFTTIH